MTRKLVVGNWKMHGSKAANAELLAGILAAPAFAVEVAVCVPFPYLCETAAALAGSALRWGAQDCSAHQQGAYTGEVAPAMLVEFGCSHVIVGHSERRAMHAESDQLVADKARAALACGLTPIVCVGETLQQHEAGETAAVVQRQLSSVIDTLGASLGEVVVAYEPVWAIGTGRSASPRQAQDVHQLLRARLRAATPLAARVKLLYGGSVKPDNAAALFAQADIDGALVGGAALKHADFVAICGAAG